MWRENTGPFFCMSTTGGWSWWAARALVSSGDGSALVWQKSGSLWVQQFAPTDTVISTGKGAVSDGVAVTGGRGGQEIQIRLI